MIFHHRFRGLLALLFLFGATSGCNIIGAAGSKLLPPQKFEAAYKGLKGNSVGVMVWADRGNRIDYPRMQLDTATSIQNKLILAQRDKKKDLEGTTFPVETASIVRYQMDYPQIETLQLTDVAPKLGVQRLIYVEIESFATRPQPSVELFRGEMSGTVKVIEVGPDKKGKMVFEENNIRAVFPKKSPEDGVPGADDVRIYIGVVDAFTTELVKRFHEWEEEE
jgi:hypothetical protein